MQIPLGDPTFEAWRVYADWLADEGRAGTGEHTRALRFAVGVRECPRLALVCGPPEAIGVVGPGTPWGGVLSYPADRVWKLRWWRPSTLERKARERLADTGCPVGWLSGITADMLVDREGVAPPRTGEPVRDLVDLSLGTPNDWPWMRQDAITGQGARLRWAWYWKVAADVKVQRGPDGCETGATVGARRVGLYGREG